MREVGSAFGIRRVFGLALMLTLLLLCWATAAYAQTPNDAQYGNPTASGEAAIEASGGSGTPTSEGSTASGIEGILPATGGPLLAFLGLSMLALGSATGLILRLNRNRR